jgi:uncharacterized protein (TIGR02594 family)
VEQAKRIIANAPRGGTPISVARYFEALRDVNSDGESYNAEWAVRANPLIVAFFASTKTAPAGDTTAWCAAFVNFCLKVSGMSGTGSASSGSFRCAGRNAVQPSAGDIAVFRNHTDVQPCAGRGHVAFFLQKTETHVKVLGGNQRNRIKESDYALVDDALVYLGARDVNSMP